MFLAWSHHPSFKRQGAWQINPRMTALGEMNVLFFGINLAAFPNDRWTGSEAALQGTLERVCAILHRHKLSANPFL